MYNSALSAYVRAGLEIVGVVMRFGGLLGWTVGRATNAIMTQVAAAWNVNAILMILRECLHKCLLSGEAEGRRGGP